MASTLDNFLKKTATADMMDWPEDAILYQPFEVEQILLAESASCLAVRTYLKMLNLRVKLEQRANTEFISPGGKRTKVPVLRVENFIHAEFESIATFIELCFDQKLTSNLSPEDKDNDRAMCSLAENIFTVAEQYISWVDAEVRETVSKKRNGSVYPFPLNYVQNWRKEAAVRQQLRLQNRLYVSLEEVIDDFDQLCSTLSTLLGSQQYFFGDDPSKLDALVFGHLYSIITCPLPKDVLALKIKNYSNLVDFVRNIQHKYFLPKELYRHL